MDFFKCPLLKKNIEDIVCFDITMVAEGAAPKWTAPKEATVIDGFDGICLNCPNHKE